MDVANNTLSIRNCTDFSEATLSYPGLTLILTPICRMVQVVVEGLIRRKRGTFVGLGKPGGRDGRVGARRRWGAKGSGQAGMLCDGWV